MYQKLCIVLMLFRFLVWKLSVLRLLTVSWGLMRDVLFYQSLPLVCLSKLSLIHNMAGLFKFSVMYNVHGNFWKYYVKNKLNLLN